VLLASSAAVVRITRQGHNNGQRESWGQFAGNSSLVHSARGRFDLVVRDSRLAAQGNAQGLSLAKPLITQAKMVFCTGSSHLYYYDQSEKKTARKTR
jgi:hypothetical protein